MTAEAEMFSGWLHDENFGSTDADSVVESAHLAQFGNHMTPTQFLSVPMTYAYWPTAFAALHNPSLAVATASVAADLVPAGAFESGHQVDVHFLVDVGAGLEDLKTIPTKANIEGLRYVAMGFPDDVRTIRVIFGEDPGVTRIDALRLTLGVEGEQQRVLDFGDPDLAIRVARGFSLEDRVVIGPRSGPAIDLFWPGSWPQPYRFLLEIAFAVLPTPTLRPSIDQVWDVARAMTRRASQRLAAWRRPPATPSP